MSFGAPVLKDDCMRTENVEDREMTDPLEHASTPQLVGCRFNTRLVHPDAVSDP